MGLMENILPVLYLSAGLLIFDGVISIAQKKTPFWMTRQVIRAYLRFIRQMYYLHRIQTEFGKQSGKGTAILSNVNLLKAVRHDAASDPEPVFDIINRAVKEATSLVISGEQGVGKTIALRSAVARVAKRAYNTRMTTALIFLAIFALLVIVAPWAALLWVVSYVLWETLLFRVPLPLLFHADDVAHGITLLTWYEQQISEQLGGKPLFHEDRWLVLFVDGLDRLSRHHIHSFFQDLNAYLILYPIASVIILIHPELELSDIDVEMVEYEIQPLEDESVKALIEWHLLQRGIADQGILNEKAKHYLRELEANGLTRENSIGRNAFWLDIIIATGKFTTSKARLLHSFIDLQLRKALDKAKGNGASLQIFMKALSHMSLSMLPYGYSGLRGRSEIQHQLELVRSILEGSNYSVGEFLSIIQETGLIEYEPERRVKFTHASIQNYFAAYALYLRDDWGFIARKANDLSWWPVIFILGVILDEHNRRDRLDNLTAELTADEVGFHQYLAVYGIHRGLGRVPSDVMQLVINGLVRCMPVGFGQSEQQAIEQLVALLGDEAIELFEQIYQSQDPQQQLIATILLCATGIPQCDDMLLNKPMQEALPVFQKLGIPAIEYLISRLESDDDVICYRASELLIALGSPVLEYLGNGLDHPRARVRRYVTRIIARISGDNAFELLFQALADDDYDVWYQAADGLRNLGGSAQPMLKRLMNDPGVDPRLRKRIELVLSAKPSTRGDFEKVDATADFGPDTSKIEGPSRAMGEPSAFQVLLKPGFRFSSSGRKEGRAFRQSPYQIRSSGSRHTLVASDSDEDTVNNESVAFSTFDFPPDFEQLLKRLWHPNVYIRSTAIEEVRKFGTALVPYLLKALETDNKAQILGVLDALAEVANINSLKALRTFRDKAIDLEIRRKTERVIQRSRLRTM